MFRINLLKVGRTLSVSSSRIWLVFFIALIIKDALVIPVKILFIIALKYLYLIYNLKSVPKSFHVGLFVCNFAPLFNNLTW